MKTVEQAWKERGVDDDMPPPDEYVNGWMDAIDAHEVTKQVPLTWLQFCKAMKDGFGAEEWDETLENAPEHDRAELTRVLRMIEAAHGIKRAKP